MELVPFSSEHLGAWDAIGDDPLVKRFTPLPVPAPPGFAADWLARYRRDGLAAFAVVDEEEVVGLAMTPVLDPASGVAELGYLVLPAHRGRGVAGEALRLLTAWVREQGLTRLLLRIDHDNVASQRVAARCGYVLERDGGVQLWSLPTG